MRRRGAEGGGARAALAGHGVQHCANCCGTPQQGSGRAGSSRCASISTSRLTEECASPSHAVITQAATPAVAAASQLGMAPVAHLIQKKAPTAMPAQPRPWPNTVNVFMWLDSHAPDITLTVFASSSSSEPACCDADRVATVASASGPLMAGAPLLLRARSTGSSLMRASSRPAISSCATALHCTARGLRIACTPHDGGEDDALL